MVKRQCWDSSKKTKALEELDQGRSKKDYLEAKRNATRAIYDAKSVTMLKRFRNMWKREDDRAQVFKIAKQITTENWHIVADK